MNFINWQNRNFLAITQEQTKVENFLSPSRNLVATKNDLLYDLFIGSILLFNFKWLFYTTSIFLLL